MRIHDVPVDEALATLRSTYDGLAATDAERRLQEYGPNRIKRDGRRRHAPALLKEFTQFFSIVLWIAAGLAFLLEHISPGQNMARLAYSIVAVILISGFFSFLQEFRAERTLAALLRLLPTQVQVVRAGLAYEKPADELVPGDVVLLADGESVPADCRIIESYGARVNMATLTGESTPRPCEARPSSEEALLRAKNVLLAGTTLVAGRVRAVVFATGMRTEFGAITALAHTSAKAVSPLRQQIAHLSRLIVLLAVGIGALFFTAGWWLGLPMWANFVFAIGIIVAMVPEGLLPTLTLALVLASQRMAARKVLIRHLPAVEALGSTTVICTDKTGTLTQNRMTVKTVFIGSPEDASEIVGRDAAQLTLYRPFFLAAALCHDVAEGQRNGAPTLLGDPMEVALVEMGRAALNMEIRWPRVNELPFDTERMRLSTVYMTPQGLTLYCKGAPEAVLPLCTHALDQGEIRAFSDALRQTVAGAHADMAERGQRVLAFAFRSIEKHSNSADLEQGLVFCGLAGLEDPPRQEVPGAIRKCREAGIRVIMVTGDHPATARAVAREIGLATSARATVITGDELRRLSATQLQLALDTPEIIFARVSPDQKLRIVEALRSKQEIVAVTGDGVNDAPALTSAHIGVAMGVAGTDVARSAADVVLLDDNFASIVDGVEEGRAVFDNIRKFLTYILAHNMAELVPYIAYVLMPIPLALTPIQMLAIDMGTDSLTALGLGVERADPRVMHRPPRSQQQRLLDWRLAARAYLFLGAIESVAALSAFFIVLSMAGWTYGEPLASSSTVYMQATTACLIAIVVTQSTNVFVCRSYDRSILATGVRGNPLILIGVALGLALAAAIAYLPVLNAFFGTAPVSFETWLIALPFAIALIIFEEARKLVVRRHVT